MSAANTIHHRQEYSILKNKPVALYTGVKQFVTEKIHSREWPPESKIPSEHALVDMLGVSRVTVNRALRELTEEKYIIRLQGVGSFVAPGKSESNIVQIRSIAVEIRSRGHDHRAVILKLRTIDASKENATVFGLEPSGKIFHSEILHLDNSLPVQLENRYVLPQAAPGYLQQDFQTQTPHDYLMAVAALYEADHIIEAQKATKRQRRLLEMKKNEPCLMVTRHSRSKTLTVSLAYLAHPGARYRLQGHITGSL